MNRDQYMQKRNWHHGKHGAIGALPQSGEQAMARPGDAQREQRRVGDRASERAVYPECRDGSGATAAAQ